MQHSTEDLNQYLSLSLCDCSSAEEHVAADLACEGVTLTWQMNAHLDIVTCYTSRNETIQTPSQGPLSHGRVFVTDNLGRIMEMMRISGSEGEKNVTV